MNETDSKRPLRHCARGEGHEQHFWLFTGGPHGPEYSRCPGRPEGGDPAATRIDIPVQSTGDMAMGGLGAMVRDWMLKILEAKPSAADDFATMQRLRFGNQMRDGHVRIEMRTAAGQVAADSLKWDEDFPADSDLAHILFELLPEIDVHMRLGGAHYGYEAQHALGLRGQYADMYRKWTVLKRVMWDGEMTTREPLREILKDLIGHALLTIAMLDNQPAASGTED